jgi:sugar (pentulose or hexulose) kinase
MKNPYLAFDLGAGTGRAFLGSFDHKRILIEEFLRFENKPVRLLGAVYWDFLLIWDKVLQTLVRCSSAGHKALSGIGIDSWNMDFGLVDDEGRLLWNPVSYRDQGGEGVREEFNSRTSELALYRETGIPIFPITGLSRLLQINRFNGREALDSVKYYLPVPDLVRFFLTSQASVEETISWGSQMVSIHKRMWSERVISQFNVNKGILPKLIPAGKVAGYLSDSVTGITGLKRCPVLTVAEHDTMSAVYIAHGLDQEAAILSAGTWSIIGAVIDKPNVTRGALDNGFMNELASESIFFGKNVMGFYFLEELMKIWRVRKIDCDYPVLIDLACSAPSGRLRIDPNDPLFFSPPNAVSVLKQYCDKTGQEYTEDVGILTRGIYDGLALSYADAFRQLKLVLNKSYDRIVMVGGGVRNRFFCQLTSNACGVEVKTGPAEATVMGNLCFQALSLGRIKTEGLSAMLENSCDIISYHPEKPEYI